MEYEICGVTVRMSAPARDRWNAGTFTDADMRRATARVDEDRWVSLARIARAARLRENGGGYDAHIVWAWDNLDGYEAVDAAP